jgi:hypothetical protein
MPTDVKHLMAEADALIAQAQELPVRYREVAGRLAQFHERHEEQMRNFVSGMLRDAELGPVLPAAETPPDAATVFARRVFRRRAVV